MHVSMNAKNIHIVQDVYEIYCFGILLNNEV